MKVNKKMLVLVLVTSLFSGCAWKASGGTPEAYSRMYEGEAGIIEVAKAPKGKGTDYMAARQTRYDNDTPLERLKYFASEAKAKIQGMMTQVEGS